MKHKKACCILALLLLMFPLLAACGNNTATAMRLRKTEGTVNVSDGKDKKVEAREDLNLYDGYSVNTESESYAWVTLDSVKLTKMDQSSGIKIQKSGKKLKVNVESGSLFFNITEPLKDDESLDIRTSTLGIGVRGTCGWVESSEDGNTSRVYLLEGEVECTAVSEDGADNQSVSIAAGEKASLTEGGEIVVEKFDADAIPAFVRDEAEEDEALQNILDQGGWNAPDSSGGALEGHVEHILTEANYQQAATCEVCGETVGEPLQAAFEKYGLACNAELNTEYAFEILCYDDPQYTTKGSYSFSDYEVFESDDKHEALEGYEWKAVTATMAFSGENAFKYGFGPSFASLLDYYDSGFLDTYDENTGSYTIKYNGMEFSEVKYDAEVLQEGWQKPDTDNEELLIAESKYTLKKRVFMRLPKGYDGIVYTFIPAEVSREIDKAELYKIAKENSDTICFRFK